MGSRMFVQSTEQANRSCRPLAEVPALPHRSRSGLVYIMYLMRTNSSEPREYFPRFWPWATGATSSTWCTAQLLDRVSTPDEESCRTQIGGATVRLRNVPPLVTTKAREPYADGVWLVPSETWMPSISSPPSGETRKMPMREAVTNSAPLIGTGADTPPLGTSRRHSSRPVSGSRPQSPLVPLDAIRIVRAGLGGPPSRRACAGSCQSVSSFTPLTAVFGQTWTPVSASSANTPPA